MKLPKILVYHFSARLLVATKKEMHNLSPSCPYLYYQPMRPISHHEEKKMSK